MTTHEIDRFVPVKSANTDSLPKFGYDRQVLPHTAVNQPSFDKYERVAANESVVAKVLSQSIEDALDRPKQTLPLPTNSNSKKFEYASHGLANVARISENILNEVKSTMFSAFSGNNATGDVTYFKEEVIKGISIGVKNAKEELGLNTEGQIIKQLDTFEASLIREINDLPKDIYHLSALKHKADFLGTDQSLNELKINLSHENASVSIKFMQHTLEEVQTDSAMYNTAKSNLLFSVTGSYANQELDNVADIVNKADELVNQFYIQDIETIFQRAKNKGASENEIISIAKQIINKEHQASTIPIYEEIKHVDAANDTNELKALRKVAEYVANLHDFVGSAEAKFASRSEYKQIINGIVNQMEDVQVPDLLQAINKFHSFNEKFI
ncbi:hypothetical protein [Agaribacter flavus]|uniref:Uncharacterized protein n=1 Tax=Agaribacter flavus TaxID=1902781 RepID=A0ABV7FPR9_9ALTE